MSSIFTPPGTNAAQGQDQQNQNAQQTNNNLLGQWAPIVQQQMGYYGSQLPTANSAVSGLGALTTQGGRNSMVSAFGANARGGAQTAASQMPGQYAGNPSLGQAFGLGAYNDANKATNQYSQQLNSPEGQASAAGGYLGALNSSMQPSFSGIQGLTQGVYGAPKVQVGQGLLGYLGSIAGPLSGMLTGSGGGGNTSGSGSAASGSSGGYGNYSGTNVPAGVSF